MPGTPNSFALVLACVRLWRHFQFAVSTPPISTTTLFSLWCEVLRQTLRRALGLPVRAVRCASARFSMTLRWENGNGPPRVFTTTLFSLWCKDHDAVQLVAQSLIPCAPVCLPCFKCMTRMSLFSVCILIVVRVFLCRARFVVCASRLESSILCALFQRSHSGAV